MRRSLSVLVALPFIAACASGGGGSPFEGGPPEGSVELIVRNQLLVPLTAYVEWRGSTRSRLGEVPGGTTRSFSEPIRGADVRVVGVPVGRGPSGQAAADFALARPGDRIEWGFLATGPQPYVRLPSN